MINFCTCLIEEIHDFFMLIKTQKMINSLSKLIFIYVCRSLSRLTNILTSQLGPPKPKFLAQPLYPVCNPTKLLICDPKKETQKKRVRIKNKKNSKH